jgi:hypothetical protein
MYFSSASNRFFLINLNYNKITKGTSMKHFNKKLISCIICTILVASGFTLTAGTKAFNFLPKECNIVGSINLSAIKTIKSVNDAINQTEQDPVYQSLKASGLSIDNITNIYFGMFLDKIDKAKPSFLAVLQTEKECDIKKFVEDSPTKDKNINITTEKYNGKDVYVFVNKKDAKTQNKKDVTTDEPVYCVTLDKNLVALGTKDYIHKCIDNNGKTDSSIVANKEIMTLVGDTERSDMIWIASVIPEGFTAQAAGKGAKAGASKIPNVKNGILALNYKDKSLILTGKLNCKTPQDVQKIMLPAQMFLGIFAMNPDSGIDPQDISLKPKGTELSIDITIPEKALESIVNSQNQNVKKDAPASNAPHK